MRILIGLLVVIFGFLYVFEQRLSTFQAPTVEQVAPASMPVAAAPRATQPRADVVQVPTPAAFVTGDRLQALVNAATSWLGVRYAWGGCSRSGVDCSCFVMNALAVIGIHAPRVTTDQIRWASPINAADAHTGDLVFFDNTCTGCGPNPTHVGLYLGGGTMIDAGDPVRIESVYSGHNARYGRPLGL